MALHHLPVAARCIFTFAGCSLVLSGHKANSGCTYVSHLDEGLPFSSFSVPVCTGREKERVGEDHRQMRTGLGREGARSATADCTPVGCRLTSCARCLKDFSIIKPHLSLFFLDRAQENEIIKYIIMKASTWLLK